MQASAWGLRPTYETVPGVFVHNVTDDEAIISIKLEPLPETEDTGNSGANAALQAQADPDEVPKTKVHVRQQVLNGQILPYFLSWYMERS